ncbi:MAG: DUF1361 domain-containing protein [Anaerolineales bacterium]|nr:DUF1361 domain-containing protein [Anaerolineales bacterium]
MLHKQNEIKLVLWGVAGSLLAVLLFAGRWLAVGNFTFDFVVWNLFLAWLPLLFAAMAWRWWEKRPFSLLCTTLWLLFFPNAPYILTDFIHLRQRGGVPIWFDFLLLLAFALAGLYVGLLSLDWLHRLVARENGRFWGWFFVFTTLSLSSFGVYMGRFWRWNSWDMLLQPTAVLSHLSHTLANPIHAQHTAAVTLLLTIILLISYTCFKKRRDWEIEKVSLPAS